MSYEYFTMVKASPGFWNKKLIRELRKVTSFEIKKIKDDGIMIITSNKNALKDIIGISKDYPDELFQTKIAGEDVYNNYVYLYECCNGDSKLIKEGYEYIFSIEANAFSKLDKDLIKKFEEKVVGIYQKIDRSYTNEVHLNILFDENQNEAKDDIEDLSIIVKYRTKNVCLTAEKQGLTHININVEFFDKQEEHQSPEKESQNDDGELPF
ncbi:MAG: hypothetical protein ABSF81_17660 [Bacteroidales bacterium]